MKTYGLYESAAVKVQTLKTAIEVNTLLCSIRGSADTVAATVCLLIATDRRHCQLKEAAA